MDIKEYISSGILEGYTLGILSDQEMKEVECMSHIYPEIEAELRSIQKRYEEIALENALDVPEDMESRILAEINTTKQEAPVLKLNTATTQRKESNLNLYKTLGYAASIIILAGLGVGLFLKNKNLQENYESQIIGYQKDKSKFEADKLALKNELSELQNKQNLQADRIAFLSDSSTKKIILAGTNGHENTSSIVYWNANSKKVFLQTDKLPEPSPDLQFQLWALVEGKPVDLGVFDVGQDSLELKEMISITKAEAFAITLETKGGNASPNLEQIFVLGKI